MYNAVGPAFTIELRALLLLHEIATRVASLLFQAEVSRAEKPSPPIVVWTKSPVLNELLLPYGVESRLKKLENW